MSGLLRRPACVVETTYFLVKDAVVDVTLKLSGGEHINWTFIGGYEIYDVNGYEDLKILTLNYENGDIEEFELSVINDQRIELYNIVSETTYEFSGRGFVQYLKGGKSKKEANGIKGNIGRKRTKISRKIKNRRKLK